MNASFLLLVEEGTLVLKLINNMNLLQLDYLLKNTFIEQKMFEKKVLDKNKHPL
jgi:hypothetical protein